MYILFDIIEHIKCHNRFILNDEHFSFLIKLTKYAKEHSSVIIKKGTPLYRTRSIPFEDECHRKEEMLAPPPEKCIQGRLNPAGIPYLYCAFEGKTAFLEQRPSRGDSFSLATLRTNRDISVINMNRSDGLKYTQDEYGFVNVLNHIGDLFSIPVHKDDPVGYAPTQYFAEMLKNTGTDGIKYKSAMNSTGHNLVIFDQRLVEVIDVVPRKIGKMNIGFIYQPFGSASMPTYSEPKLQ